MLLFAPVAVLVQPVSGQNDTTTTVAPDPNATTVSSGWDGSANTTTAGSSVVADTTTAGVSSNETEESTAAGDSGSNTTNATAVVDNTPEWRNYDPSYGGSYDEESEKVALLTCGGLVVLGLYLQLRIYRWDGADKGVNEQSMQLFNGKGG